MDRILRGSALEPYFKIAEERATASPCVRRQYAALIGYESIQYDPLWAVECNSRQSRCCNNSCRRTDYGVQHGQRVEVGAEIHAETAVLIAAKNQGQAFILVGFANDSPLYGENVYPCHSCALAIRFAGYSYIYIRQDKDTISAVGIAEIIEYREEEWLNVS